MSRQDISILSDIDLGHLNVIRSDFDLIFQDVELLYVVDTYDVIQASFPTLVHSDKRNVPESFLVSSFLAYDFLFFHYRNKPVILEDYKVELFSVWNEIYREASFLMNNDSNEGQVSRIKEKIKTDKEWVKRNMGLFLSIFLGLLTDNSMKRYRNLLKNRLQVERFDIADEEDRMIIEEIFSTVKVSNDVPMLFEQFCQSADQKINGLKREEKYAYLENAYVDIVVFSRIVRINEAIQLESRLKKKYLFLYLSSTPSKSAKIENIFVSHHLLPTVFGKEQYPILRNISQFYFKELIHGSAITQKEVGEQLSKCEDILKEFGNREVLISHLSGNEKVNMTSFNNKIDSNRKELENIYLLYKSFSSYKQRIYAALEGPGKINADEELKGIIEELLKSNSTDELGKDKLMLSLVNYKEEFTLQNKILKLLADVQSKNDVVKLHILPGKDIVRSYAQLYPSLLFFYYLQSSGYSFIKDFFITIISPKNYEKNFIIKKYSELKSVSLFHIDSYERKLYYLFLDMLIPGPDPDSNMERIVSYQQESEENIISELRKMYEINKWRDTKLVKHPGEGVYKVTFSANDLEIEIAYFLSWLYRRAQRYDEAIALLDYTIRLRGFADPRLFHSRALCYISEIYQNTYVAREYLRNRYQLALNDLEEARGRFEREFNGNPKEDMLLWHVYIAICNTQCDLYIRLYEIEDKEFAGRIVDYVRPLLDEFKIKLERIGENYKDYPTYNHTEADLYYCESLIAYSNNDLSRARSKINQAAHQLSQIEDDNDIMVDSVLKSSRMKINQLSTFLKKATGN